MRELELNYWDRLKHLGLYSLERRRERYIILYTWKMITELASNFESETSRIVTYYNERRRRLCRIPLFNNRAAARVQTLREGSLSVAGPRLFNALQKVLRGGEFTLAKFKRRLDNWLRKIPDCPVMGNYPQQVTSNSILHQLALWRANRWNTSNVTFGTRGRGDLPSDDAETEDGEGSARSVSGD